MVSGLAADTFTHQVGFSATTLKQNQNAVLLKFSHICKNWKTILCTGYSDLSIPPGLLLLLFWFWSILPFFLSWSIWYFKNGYFTYQRVDLGLFSFNLRAPLMTVQVDRRFYMRSSRAARIYRLSLKNKQLFSRQLSNPSWHWTL